MPIVVSEEALARGALVVGVLACLVALVSGGLTVASEMRTEDATGRVLEVSAKNATCGSGKRRSTCTQYLASVAFDDHGVERIAKVDAGHAADRDQPLNNAWYRAGDEMELRYQPGTADAVRAGTDNPWVVTIGASVMAFFLLGWAFVRRAR